MLLLLLLLLLFNDPPRTKHHYAPIPFPGFPAQDERRRGSARCPLREGCKYEYNLRSTQKHKLDNADFAWDARVHKNVIIWGRGGLDAAVALEGSADARRTELRRLCFGGGATNPPGLVGSDAKGLKRPSGAGSLRRLPAASLRKLVSGSGPPFPRAPLNGHRKAVQIAKQNCKPINHSVVGAVPAPGVLFQGRVEGVLFLGVERSWDRIVQRSPCGVNALSAERRRAEPRRHTHRPHSLDELHVAVRDGAVLELGELALDRCLVGQGAVESYRPT